MLSGEWDRKTRKQRRRRKEKKESKKWKEKQKKERERKGTKGKSSKTGIRKRNTKSQTNMFVIEEMDFWTLAMFGLLGCQQRVACWAQGSVMEIPMKAARPRYCTRKCPAFLTTSRTILWLNPRACLIITCALSTLLSDDNSSPQETRLTSSKTSVVQSTNWCS